MILIKQTFLRIACLSAVLTFSTPCIFAQLNMHQDTTAEEAAINSVCDKARPFAVIATEFTKTVPFQAAVSVIKSGTNKEPHREYIISFGKDSQGKVTLSQIAQGNKSNGLIPAIPNAFADLHNHPRNTPPSSGDLYGLMAKNQKQSSYTTRYVLTAGGTMYALVVIDTAAVRTFVDQYPPQQVKGYSPLFPDELLNEYREIQQRYGVLEERAMTYMLHHYRTGVILLKQDNHGEFILLHTKSIGSGDDRKFMQEYCQRKSDQ